VSASSQFIEVPNQYVGDVGHTCRIAQSVTVEPADESGHLGYYLRCLCHPWTGQDWALVRWFESYTDDSGTYSPTLPMCSHGTFLYPTPTVIEAS